MSLPSALIKKILDEDNLETWSNLKKIYLPSEYHSVYKVIEKHVDTYFKLPTFEELNFEVRDQATKDRLFLIEKEEVDAESFFLLDSLKGEFAMKRVMTNLTKLVDESIAFDSPEEVLSSLYEVAARVELEVDLTKKKDNIEKVELFDTKEELEGSLKLGLNAEYDERFIFPNDSFILMGGHRGSGKSIVCNNIAQYQVEQGKSVIKFSLEMNVRQELQRQCAIATGIDPYKIKYQEFSVAEWEKIALWWAGRYHDGQDVYEQVYLKDRDFSALHNILSKRALAEPAIDFIHSPNLTMPKFKAEVLKRLNKYDKVGLIIVDYMNKMSYSDRTDNKFEWTEQLKVADGLKSFAEEIELPILSPFQTKADGTVKFSKDILVPADAGFSINKGADWIELENIKMRHMEEKGFVSRMNWMSLKAGPETAVKVVEGEEEVEEAQDI